MYITLTAHRRSTETIKHEGVSLFYGQGLPAKGDLIGIEDKTYEVVCLGWAFSNPIKRGQERPECQPRLTCVYVKAVA